MSREAWNEAREAAARRRIAAIVRIRFPFLGENYPEDMRQEIWLAARLYSDLPDGEFLRAVGRHLYAVARNYGYWRPWDRRRNRYGTFTRHAVPAVEIGG